MEAGEARARVYVILGSHACRTGTLLLEHKGIPFETVVMPTGGQRMLPLFGFHGGTVPAVVMDGQRVQTNPAIARFLDQLQPDPPLFPRDAAQRTAVEAAEHWGDEVFQMATRRITMAGVLHGPDTFVNQAAAGRLGTLLWRRPRMRKIGVSMVGRFVFDVNERTEADLLAELPPMLDRIDAWIEAGVLNGEQLYAADYMIATCLGLLAYRHDLLPELEGRPALALADRVVPEPSRAGTPDSSGAARRARTAA